MTRVRITHTGALAVFAALLLCGEAVAEDRSSLGAARVDESLGAALPLDLELDDHLGRRVSLRETIGGRPTLLLFGYFHCEMLCGLVFRGAADGIRALEEIAGELPDYRVVAISIDPRDAPPAARDRRRALLEHVGWSGERWPFLTGDGPATRAVADSVGFRYRYDPATLQYAHPAVMTVVSGDGHVSSYLYGIDFDPNDIARALRDAAAGRERSPIERALLRCFHYVPALRQYADEIATFLKLGGAAIVGVMLAGFVWVRRLERRGQNA